MATPINNFPGLGPGQTAWQVDPNTIVVVELLRVQLADDSQVAGFAVRAWQANSDGTVATDGSGNPLEIPKKAESVSLSALAEGTVVLSTFLDGCTTDALTRAQTWLAVRAQLDAVPMEQ